MKKVVYDLTQMQKLVAALNTLKVQGLDQANALVICQQILDSPIDVFEEPENDKEGEAQ